ncbi:MAG TPA: nitroreductase [Steroidobacteraceae bacterium]|jgi:nitroreductase|nr:nitroreductase [Steroidobacteraceae bacterium]
MTPEQAARPPEAAAGRPSEAARDAAAQALAALLSRHSVPALQLHEPGPDERSIEAALAAAVCAPDHGALHPLRFVLIRGAARERLSQLFVRRMLERDPGIPPAKLDKAGRQPRTAPLVIAVGAHILREHKIPESEQLLSCGAGVMNLLNAFHAQGYGAIWLTGANAYDRQVAEQLGFGPDERCLGFVYVGSVGAQPPQGMRPPRAQRAAVAREWDG